MFMIDHPDTPLVTFNHVHPLLISSSPLISGAVAVALVAFFAFTYLRLLWWNLKEYRAHRNLSPTAEFQHGSGPDGHPLDCGQMMFFKLNERLIWSPKLRLRQTGLQCGRR
jgi:hypothetical protein